MALDLIRRQSANGNGKATIPATEVEHYTRALLGEQAEAILGRIGMDELESLLMKLLAVYAPGAQSPNRKARRAVASGSR